MSVPLSKLLALTNNNNTTKLIIKELKQLKQLHSKIIQNSLHNQNYWISFLIRQCTQIRAPVSYTHLIFLSIPNPNIYVFTSILKFYSQLGPQYHHHIFSLFYQIGRNCLKPDASVYPILIKSCGKDSVSLLHCHVFKLGFSSDSFVRNAVMDMYAKYGFICSARQVFDEMSDRNIADWNSMISGYWKWGYQNEASCLFELMRDKNVISWTAMVSGYCKSGDLENARRVFREMPEKSVVSWNAMLSGYVQNGFVQEGLNLFEEMMDVTDIKPDETTWVTIISSCAAKGDPELAKSLVSLIDSSKINLNCFIKTALIDMYAKCGSLETARRIFDDMGSQRNLVSWNALISAYTKNADLASAREVFNKMPEKNVVSWNSLITGYAQNGQSSMAIELFKEMLKTCKLKPDEVTMVSVISACGHLGALEFGKRVISFCREHQIRLSISGYNSVISMYSRCGSIEDAKKTFQEMPKRDVVSYNSLIAGFAFQGNGIKAFELILKMKEEGIEPDGITFMAVLTACSHAGLSREGQELFKSIRNPAVDHYACMVDLLGRIGELDEAKKLVDEMPMKPHAGVYGALLNACRLHKRVEIGELAAYELFELEPENSGNYVLLSNIYASMGRWEDVEKIRELMKKKGVTKTTGWSWVEYEGNVHRFIAGDRGHKYSEEIYKLLKELGKRMRDMGYVADKSCVLRDVEEEEKEEMVGTHSEKLAIGFALVVSGDNMNGVIRVVKNLRVCGDCHRYIKILSKLVEREIVVRDNNRFHCFKDGECSCKDYW